MDKDSRTEQATGRQREKFREEGRVAVSNEIIAMAVLMVSGVVFFMTASHGGKLLFDTTSQMLGKLDELTYGDNSIWLPQIGMLMVYLVFPVGGAAVVAALISGFAQTRGLFAWDAVLKFDVAKFNPFPRLKDLFFSKHTLINLGQSLGKVMVIVLVCFQLFWQQMQRLVELVDYTPLDILIVVSDATLQLGLRAAVLLTLFAIVDYIVANHRMEEQMKMTKEEVKREFKEQEGDPLIKGKRRARQRELSRGRMMTKVPHADVVLINPTHYAVALKYDAIKMGAPRLVAKGADDVALRIRDVARTNRVPVIHNPPLARALFSQVSLDGEVPPALYAAVAEVLAFVYRLRGKRA